MKAMVIYNPRSGKKQAPRIGAIAARMEKALNIQLDVRAIEGPGHGTELAKEAVANGYDRVISVGGDGTNNAIAQGLLGSQVPMGIVAMGSGNGYARSIGLPLEPEAALRHALTAPARAMDVCYLNDHLFLGTAGIGFDARVADRFDRSSTRGMFTYARIIVQEIFGAPPMPVEVLSAGRTLRENVLMLVFCNTREFGNGADISPGSRPDDGLAELRVVRKPPFVPLIKAFYDIYTHRADRNPYLTNIQATEATVRQGGTMAHLDGEPLEVGHEVRFRLEPAALMVVAPRSSAR
ncbi:MAG: diacylglycerol kinase family lipid kinase [Flavobacteriales bacterium]|nr:diacylglycerol kinase family lipid kinase [Flavobacteriales bacterium]